MPPVLSSWAAVSEAQELMYRCEQHPSGSGFSLLMIFCQCLNNFPSYYKTIIQNY